MSKVEKIKAEIERLKNELSDNKERLSLGEIIAVNNCYNNLIFFINSLEEEPISKDLEEAAHLYIDTTIECFDSEDNPCCYPAFIAGAQWQKANLWKDAQGDDLPEIDREVIVLVKSLPEYEDSLLRVSFAHRPPEYWMGKSISTGEITRYEPKRYDKGGWNQPNVVYWLDVELPKEEE